jgi:hypothetical protein
VDVLSDRAACHAAPLQACEAARLSVVGVYDWLEANNKLSEHQVRSKLCQRYLLVTYCTVCVCLDELQTFEGCVNSIAMHYACRQPHSRAHADTVHALVTNPLRPLTSI